MELFGEKRTKLLSKLVSGSVQSIDSQSFVSHIPGIEAYGASYLSIRRRKRLEVQDFLSTK